MKISKNEKEPLKLLLEDGRASDTEISKKLGISPQAVGKLRKKLEKSGVIKGYSVKIDTSLLGIKVFAIGFFRFVSGKWGEFEERDIKERTEKENIIAAYRVPEGDVTHIRYTASKRSKSWIPTSKNCSHKERGYPNLKNCTYSRIKVCSRILRNICF